MEPADVRSYYQNLNRQGEDGEYRANKYVRELGASPRDDLRPLTALPAGAGTDDANLELLTGHLKAEGAVVLKGAVSIAAVAAARAEHAKLLVDMQPLMAEMQATLQWGVRVDCAGGVTGKNGTEVVVGSHLTPTERLGSCDRAIAHADVGDVVFFNGKCVHRGCPKRTHGEQCSTLSSRASSLTSGFSLSLSLSLSGLQPNALRACELRSDQPAWPHRTRVQRWRPRSRDAAALRYRAPGGYCAETLATLRGSYVMVSFFKSK